MYPVDLDLDPDQLRLDGLTAWAKTEADALAAILPAAVAAQWQAAPIPGPREDTTERARGTVTDPTLTAVLDERRAALRAQVLASEHCLRHAIVALRGIRRGLQRALDGWEGTAGG